MKVTLLDMGDEKYGDCIVVEHKNVRILVDGGHIRDFEQRGETPSIPDQLAEVLGAQPPFNFDLLVVTHCHGDHIGCLPTLVANGTVTAGTALVAHEDLGFPAPDGGADAEVDDVVARVVAALREEPRTDFKSDAELDRFISDAVKLEPSYRAMLKQLERQGTTLIRFAGIDDEDTAADLDRLTRKFAAVGLTIVGPTQDHILRCTDAIAKFTKAAQTAVRRRRGRDAAADAVTLYKQLSGMARGARADADDDLAAFVDRPGKGAALNDQSIVLKLGKNRDTVLLTGDMQLAAPEISGLPDSMRKLLQDIQAGGPYAFVKLPHHGSYNGFDDAVASALAGTKLYAVTTGRGDPEHPNPDALATLKAHHGDAEFVRTDRNGLIAIELRNGRPEATITRGRSNDFTPNRDDSVVPAAATKPPGRPPLEVVRAETGGVVEVTARIPHTATRVTITVDIEPRPTAIAAGGGAPGPRREPVAATGGSAATPPPEEPEPPPEDGPRRLAGGRALPRLLFVTRLAQLRENIGEQEAAKAERIIRDAGQQILDIRDHDDPFPEVRRALAGGDAEGVVLLGGLDVVRSIRYDTLPPPLRTMVRDNGDPDDFIVWSDQAFGDKDGDLLGELPVSRIPDGRSPRLVLNALCLCNTPPAAARFGLHNVARPFAARIFADIAGPEPILVSEPMVARTVANADIDASAIYIMLHGSDSDSTRFWGEHQRGGTLEAMNVGNIPDPCGGIVFAGCCWGALSVRTPAVRYRPDEPVQVLTPAQSIALSFLAKGARAFVGCTGAHYSPVDDRPNASLDHFGAPMHRRFWHHVLVGNAPPARALFQAKMDYIKDMPHGRTTAEEQAIEYKILRQFTCLGLGW